MNTVLAWVQNNRARTAAIATVLIGWLPLVGVPEVIVAGLLTIVGILIAGPGVHSAVFNGASVVTATRQAAAEAAVTVAEALNSHNAGALGVLTEESAVVAAVAADDAADVALKQAGVNRRDRGTPTP